MVDLQSGQVAEHLQAILDLRSDIEATTFDYQTEAPSYIDSTRMYKALNVQDYIRALQLGGYGVSVTFPRAPANLAANNDYPLSIFNTGGKSLLIYSIELQNITSGGQTQAYLFTTPSNYGIAANQIPAPITNHKSGITNAPAITAIYNQTSAGLVMPTTTTPGLIEAAAYGANSTLQLISNNNVYLLTTKTYLEVWFRVLTASIVYAKVDMVELPF